MLMFQAIILGIVQGVTEFVPISSSAHLIIVPWLFGWDHPALTSLPFDVALHLGTLVAVLWFFAGDWARLVRAGFRSFVERKIGGDHDRRMAWMLLIGCIPGGIIGALAESRIERLFHEPAVPISAPAMIVMGIIIAALAALLYAAERITSHIRDMKAVGWKDALLIGTAQALAIFPGVSRSGATITTGLALGLERATAARFSFLLGGPIIAGAGLKSLWDVHKELQTSTLAASDLLLFVVGGIAAALSGYACIKFLLQYLQKNSTDLFAWYRWALAALVIGVAIMRG
jgi:undecaprenyl-diphosphatase